MPTLIVPNVESSSAASMANADEYLRRQELTVTGRPALTSAKTESMSGMAMFRQLTPRPGGARF
jgi:hypothetical protein